MLRLAGGNMLGRSGFLVGLLFLLGAWMGPAAADTPSWQSHNAAGLQMLQEGDATAAVEQFEAAFFLATELSTADPTLGPLLNNLIFAYISAAQFDDARRAMNLWARIISSNPKAPWAGEQLGALRDLGALLAETEPREAPPVPQPTETPAPEPPADTPAPPQGTETRYAIHLASLRSEEGTQTEWRTLQERHPEQLGHRKLITREITVSEKGTFVRVLTGPFESRAPAEALCKSLSGGEQYCAVVKLSSEP